jgi:hypothetical protein
MLSISNQAASSNIARHHVTSTKLFHTRPQNHISTKGTKPAGQSNIYPLAAMVTTERQFQLAPIVPESIMHNSKVSRSQHLSLCYVAKSQHNAMYP